MFNEYDFLSRFHHAARCGFRGVEFMFPYVHTVNELAAILREEELKLVIINLPPGDWAGGERGLTAVPGRESEFREGVDIALDYATQLGCKTLQCMAGIAPEHDADACMSVFASNLRYCCDKAAKHDINICIEPKNNRDMPGYILNHTKQAEDLLDVVQRDNLSILLDLYHLQINQGDLCHHIRKLINRVGHIQIANPPGRHEPGQGEIHYPPIFDLLQELGYQGWIGCEYKPKSHSYESLAWAC